MERYLVTGGAGFIGSHLTHALLQRGHFVRILDNFETGSRDNLAGLSQNLEIIEGSICDPGTVSRAMDGIDYVLHQAARGSVPRSLQDPAGTHEINATGTLNVLTAARDARVRRVVCASSSSVYGDTEELPKSESLRPNPKSPYALTKFMLEHYCRIFSESFGLETVSLRYFNIYGPRQNPDLQYAAVIPIFIRNMMNGKPCVIYGDGLQTRDFTFVNDCVQANLLACKAPDVSGQIFNIACGGQTSVKQLFDLLSEYLQSAANPVYEPPRAGDVRHSCADITRAASALGYRPTVSLPEGLRQTADWFGKQKP